MTMSSVSSWVSWTVEASAKVTTWPQMERSHGRGAPAQADPLPTVHVPAL